MKMRWMAVAVIALMASACGGVEDESTDTQAVDTVSAAGIGSETELASGGPCGSNYCGKGTFCCNPGCGVCAPLGGGCPDVMCNVTETPEEPSSAAALGSETELASGGPCGSNYCGAGTFCCNPSCGVCAPLGGGCLDVVCDVAQVAPEESQKAAVQQAPEESLSTSCGGVVCGAGTYCCNPSCGICAPKGASCIDIAC
ncbi:MAG: hypothetical protein JXB05_22490 [Myxococcaceae bacterium]|nr:hypothetical protein [Myxococcaceae bacterium]